MNRSVRVGLLAAAGLSLFYVAVVGGVGGFDHLPRQAVQDWPWLVLILAGFAAQVALYAELRRRRRLAAAVRVAATPAASSSRLPARSGPNTMGAARDGGEIMRTFGDLEAVIMDRLWTWDRSATVREVVDDLQRSRDIAYTTVMTVMDNLHRKGALAREKHGRAWRYMPARTRDEHAADLLYSALDEAYDRPAALMRFVGRMRPTDLAAIRRALEQRQAKGRRRT